MEAGSLRGEMWEKRSYILKASAAALAFWLAEFAFQYFFLASGAVRMETSIERSFALAGTTLIGLALAIGPLFALRPEWNFITYRRTLGVAGFTFAVLHVVSVIAFFMGFNPGQIFYSLNPYFNPLIFGVIAFVIFIPLCLTSTDWAMRKLGFRNWKTVHRLAYFAFIATVLHFTQINTPILYNPAGYALVGVTVATFALELAAFAKKVRAGTAGRGAFIGAGIILLALALFSIAFLIKGAVVK
ncbi:ferric reductase-like transmembrane domain-containing protein [Candidatus Micrarchaeota archaeon]|nr:ferric reductase-like transmembrane domain-containing protein [Candidatus Micrarchaeota archaeon]